MKRLVKIGIVVIVLATAFLLWPHTLDDTIVDSDTRVGVVEQQIDVFSYRNSTSRQRISQNISDAPVTLSIDEEADAITFSAVTQQELWVINSTRSTPRYAIWRLYLLEDGRWVQLTPTGELDTCIDACPYGAPSPVPTTDPLTYNSTTALEPFTWQKRYRENLRVRCDEVEVSCAVGRHAQPGTYKVQLRYHLQEPLPERGSQQEIYYAEKTFTLTYN